MLPKREGRKRYLICLSAKCGLSRRSHPSRVSSCDKQNQNILPARHVIRERRGLARGNQSLARKNICPNRLRNKLARRGTDGLENELIMQDSTPTPKGGKSCFDQSNTAPFRHEGINPLEAHRQIQGTKEMKPERRPH